MSRYTQDSLETFFSLVRSKGGNNDHPTTSDFQTRVRLLIAQQNINACGTTNCEPDDDSILVPVDVLLLQKKRNNLQVHCLMKN